MLHFSKDKEAANGELPCAGRRLLYGKASYLSVFYSGTLANIFLKIAFIKLTLIISKMIKKK